MAKFKIYKTVMKAIERELQYLPTPPEGEEPTLEELAELLAQTDVCGGSTWAIEQYLIHMVELAERQEEKKARDRAWWILDLVEAGSTEEYIATQLGVTVDEVPTAIDEARSLQSIRALMM